MVCGIYLRMLDADRDWHIGCDREASAITCRRLPVTRPKRRAQRENRYFRIYDAILRRSARAGAAPISLFAWLQATGTDRSETISAKACAQRFAYSAECHDIAILSAWQEPRRSWKADRRDLRRHETRFERAHRRSRLELRVGAFFVPRKNYAAGPAAECARRFGYILRASEQTYRAGACSAGIPISKPLRIIETLLYMPTKKINSAIPSAPNASFASLKGSSGIVPPPTSAAAAS